MRIKILVACLILALSLADEQDSQNQPLTQNKNDSHNDQSPTLAVEQENIQNEEQKKNNLRWGIKVAHLNNGRNNNDNSDSSDSGTSVSVKIGIGVGSTLGGGCCFCFCFFAIKARGSFQIFNIF